MNLLVRILKPIGLAVLAVARRLYNRPVLLGLNFLGWLLFFVYKHRYDALLPAIFIACMLLSGCATTTTRSESETTRTNRYHLVGELRVPLQNETGTVFAPVPMDITVEHTGSESSAAHSEKRTELDTAALSNLIIGGLKQAFPALSAVGASFGQPKDRGWSTGEITAATTAGSAALALILKQIQDAKKASENTKKIEDDRDDIYEKYHAALASKTHPTSST